jgi:hypothetical protein
MPGEIANKLEEGRIGKLRDIHNGLKQGTVFLSKDPEAMIHNRGGKKVKFLRNNL